MILFLSLLVDPRCTLSQFFEVCKATIKRIGSIWDVQFRIFLVSKQIGEVQPKASVG